MFCVSNNSYLHSNRKKRSQSQCICKKGRNSSGVQKKDPCSIHFFYH